MLETSNMPSN